MKHVLLKTFIILLSLFFLFPAAANAECCQLKDRCLRVSQNDCASIPGTFFSDSECIGVYCQMRLPDNTTGCCAYAGNNNEPTCEQMTAGLCYQLDVYASIFYPNSICQNNKCISNPTSDTKPPSSINFTPQVPIPGVNTSAGELIVNYIVGIYRYGIWLAGILAFIMIIVGGLTWMLAGGSSERVSAAKSRIGAAILGLGIALSSYLILSSINPRLVGDLKLPDIAADTDLFDNEFFCASNRETQVTMEGNRNKDPYQVCREYACKEGTNILAATRAIKNPDAICCLCESTE